MAIARNTPSTKDTISAPITRASVTAMSIGVMVAMLLAIFSRPGMAKGGIPRYGAR